MIVLEMELAMVKRVNVVVKMVPHNLIVRTSVLVILITLVLVKVFVM